MWTTGASAQSAAAALRDAGAEYVSAVVVGRYLNRDYADNQRRLAPLVGAFDWDVCVVCRTPPAHHDRPA
jgi:orotate phosphoribosyltransferase